MDTRRVEANRFDMLPCITAKSDEGKAGDEPAVPPPSGPSSPLPSLVLGSWGNTMRDAVRNKES